MMVVDHHHALSVQVCGAELKAARASGGVDSVARVADLASPVGMIPTPKSGNLMVGPFPAKPDSLQTFGF